MKRTIAEFKKYFKIAPQEYTFKIIISIILRALLLLIPVLFSNVINEVTKSNYNKAIMLIIISIIVTVLYRFSECLNNYLYHKLYNKIYQYNYDQIVSVTNNNSIFSLSRFTMGEYSNIAINDVAVISTFYTNIIMRTVQFLEFIFIYSYFLNINKFLFLFVLIFSVLIFIISFKTTQKLQNLNNRVKLYLDQVTSSTNEYFLGIKEIKSFNLFEKIFQSLKNKTNNYLGANKKYNNNSIYLNQSYLFMWETVRLLSVIYGIYLLKDNVIEVGVLLIIYNYYQKIIDNFSMVLTVNLDYRILNVSLDRVKKIFEYSKTKVGKEQMPTVNGEITFKNILYGYRNNPILNKVSFYIPANSINVLYSKQSCKKKGVFELLLKLNRQHEGKIKIDNIDINDIGDNDYFKMLSITREDPFFFNMSIKENLLLVNNDFDKIVDICNKIGLDYYLSFLDKGYDTKLDNPNINSNVKQLLSIARILIKDSKIMLFDESIDILEVKSRKRILKILKELSKDHTIIISTHDEDVIDIADNIINLD